jgi:hypothetical protein
MTYIMSWPPPPPKEKGARPKEAPRLPAQYHDNNNALPAHSLSRLKEAVAAHRSADIG